MPNEGDEFVRDARLIPVIRKPNPARSHSQGNAVTHGRNFVKWRLVKAKCEKKTPKGLQECKKRIWLYPKIRLFRNHRACGDLKQFRGSIRQRTIFGDKIL
uniref:Serine/threonine-protein kinase 16 n=1 Tax=Schistocephalus solidus TaxID=70667 RepID=A0A0X3PPQ8_SCHSO